MRTRFLDQAAMSLCALCIRVKIPAGRLLIWRLNTINPTLLKDTFIKVSLKKTTSCVCSRQLTTEKGPLIVGMRTRFLDQTAMSFCALRIRVKIPAGRLLIWRLNTINPTLLKDTFIKVSLKKTTSCVCSRQLTTEKRPLIVGMRTRFLDQTAMSFCALRIRVKIPAGRLL
ncbi:hypothetical protein TNCV_4552671 [Trichonephila clavipes]|nr:hypothetical protein TNCV_4552671 [Trichonephila clavipes]